VLQHDHHDLFFHTIILMRFDFSVQTQVEAAVALIGLRTVSSTGGLATQLLCKCPSICTAIIFATQLRNKNKPKGCGTLSNTTKWACGTPNANCVCKAPPRAPGTQRAMQRSHLYPAQPN